MALAKDGAIIYLSISKTKQVMNCLKDSSAREKAGCVLQHALVLMCVYFTN